MAIDPNQPLGRGGPGGAQSYYVAMEESKARADERRRARMRGGHREMDPRVRTFGLLLGVAVVIVLMTYAVWAGLGPIAGSLAGIAFLVGVFLLWRLWG